MSKLSRERVFKISASSDKGASREHNEDMLLLHTLTLRDTSLSMQLSADKTVILAVSDGMGGQSAGEVASEHVLESLRDTEPLISGCKSESELRSFLANWVVQIHTKLMLEGESVPSRKGMGATLCAVIVWKSQLFLVNAGDSRLYRLRDGMIRQLSTDHSLRIQQNDSSLPSNVITNAIGGGEQAYLEIENISDRVLQQDQLLLCSDGLNDMLNDDQIEEILNENGNAKTLIEAANGAGGKDNISVILINVE